MAKAYVYGQEQPDINQGTTAVFSDFELVKCVMLEKTRSENRKVALDYKTDDIIVFTFTDGTQWIGNAEDIPEIYNRPEKLARSGGDFIFEAQLTANAKTRGGLLGTVVIKMLSVLRPKATKKLTGNIARKLAETYDKKAVPIPGLYMLGSQFQPVRVKQLEKQSATMLLLLHGTMSNTYGAFGGLRAGSYPIYDQLVKNYPGGIYSLEHHTLAVSPLQNALDFLNICSEDTSIDIMSHSRGGLVADVLAKCDHRNATTGFSTVELEMMKKEDPDGHKIMLAINTVLKTKNLKVGKVIRVASPASGTTILSERVDHFFNVMLNALGLALGAGANVFYEMIKEFLLELIHCRADPGAMPGLCSMVPDSAFQKMLNYSRSAVVGSLFVIAGDAEVGGKITDTLKVIMANLFYLKANDLVVDSHRMDHGVARLAGFNRFLSQDKDTNHFNYFINKNSCDAIMQAVIGREGVKVNQFTWHGAETATRGIVLDHFSMKTVNYDTVTGNRKIAIIIPGIMGSGLDAGGEPQWIDFREMNRGAIRDKLNITAKNVTASGVIENYYDKLAVHLSTTHDVVTFAFDWRLSVTDAAKILAKKVKLYTEKYNQPIHIIGHSMGGIVVRQFMIAEPVFWKDFINRQHNRFLMLGTPWLGSHLIMQVLTGHSNRVKQLAMIDFKNNKEELQTVFAKYPGMLELLPIEEPKADTSSYADVAFWTALKNDCAGSIIVPEEADLTDFATYRDAVLQFNKGRDKNDFINIFYVAGAAAQTVFGYRKEDRFLLKKKKLVYLATSNGDSSVTWASGIPQGIPEDQLYFARTSHGDLADDEKNFEGITELLLEGKTTKLLTTPPIARSGEIITELREDPEPIYNTNAVQNIIFGVRPRIAVKEDRETNVNVKVTNGDVKIASYPVMVGHFYNDGLYSAERALDGYLNGRIRQRHDMGYYPGKIGESEVFFNLQTNPHGAIICGLGDSQELTHYLLAKTVEMATLKYAMFMRDNYTLARAKKYAEGMSIITIGVGYGKLQMEDSVKGILLGVSNANRFIKKKQEGLVPITEVEFINYYESLASQAYWALSRILNIDNRFSFDLKKGVESKEGAKKQRAFMDERDDWWHIFNVKSIHDYTKKSINPDQAYSSDTNAETSIDGLEYSSSSGLARVDVEQVHNGLDQVGILLDKMSRSSEWDKDLSKTLFELLIPNRFKDIIRNQNNIIFKLDGPAAQFPWELFHDCDADETPAAVNSGLIRQLLTSDYEIVQKLGTGTNKVLVVGDPLYNTEGLPQLPAAKHEAEYVAKTFTDNVYNVKSYIQSEPEEIMLALYTDQYKIVHFAGHGIYDPKAGKIGIAIGGGICIDPAMIKQMGYVPDFVFVNCCYSGTMSAVDQKYYRARYKLAANVGTQLIEMGVKALVVTGWAVDDGAADTFSKVFYEKMIAGYEFGNAVQLARKKCFQEHRYTNTWGAYQCYGDQHFKFHEHLREQDEEHEYVLNSQVYTDLDNLYSDIRHASYKPEKVKADLAAILDNARRNNLIDGRVREKEALVYDEINMPQEALDTFKGVLTLEDANFSVKVLEHFCLLRSLNLTKGDEAERQQELDMITKLAVIGRTTLRLGIVGNAYKFASSFESTKTGRVKLLNKALQYYKEAYAIKSDPYNGPYLDAFSNVIFISYLLSREAKLDINLAFKEFSDKKPLVFLREFHQQLDDKDPEDMDISVLLGMTEVSMCLLILTHEGDEDQIVKDTCARFNETFNLLHSPRQIRMEIAQLDFLINQPAFEKKKVEFLKKIRYSLSVYE